MTHLSDDSGRSEDAAAVTLDADLMFEVALVSAVDKAVTSWSLKRSGRREFTDFIELAPANVRDACAAALSEDESA